MRLMGCSAMQAGRMVLAGMSCLTALITSFADADSVLFADLCLLLGGQFHLFPLPRTHVRARLRNRGLPLPAGLLILSGLLRCVSCRGPFCTALARSGLFLCFRLVAYRLSLRCRSSGRGCALHHARTDARVCWSLPRQFVRRPPSSATT
jgi:hypothetical protein